MFYNKELKIIDTKPGYIDSEGHWIEGKEDVVKTIKCDIQPYNNEIAYREYGYEEDVDFKAFCPKEYSFKLDQKVQYKSTDYKIVVCIEWDDYYILVLKGLM